MKLLKLSSLLSLIVALNFSACNAQKGDDKLYSEALRGGKDKIENDISNSRRNAITNSVAKCSPAVVGINVTEVRKVAYNNGFGGFSDPFGMFGNDPMFQQFFQQFGGQQRTQEYKVHSLGSGFIISEDGYIITNQHVVDNATKVVITTTKGKTYDAEIIGSDATADVALLKIKGEKFPYLKLSNSDDVLIGEWSIAFGNPFGLFDINSKPTVTLGIVSNTGINFTQEDKVYRNMIQTDAAISSGNSGGPLVNSLGEVIAVNTVIFSTAQNSKGAGSIGIGFAIPINRVKMIVDKFKDGEKIDRNFFVGMDVQDVTDDNLSALKLSSKQGVLVSRVFRKSSAEDAGIEPGDVITSIDGNKINSSQDFLVVVYDSYVGKELKFEISRNGDEITKYMKLKPKQK